MSAIISDQFRILNAENFVKSFVSVGNSNSYYTFIGQPNSNNPQANGLSTWGSGVPPLDGFKEENEIKETIIALKKITSSDVRRVIRKVNWTAGTIYEMYRNDYSIYNLSPITNSSSLYDCNYYVVNQNLQVYLCLNNGYSPDNLKGKASLDEPSFVDLDPRPAGDSGDGYIWKYLFTIKPSEIIKFDTVEYIPVPENWGEVGESISIKNNAIDGKIETVLINSYGNNYSSTLSKRTFTNIPILGDGFGGKVTITLDSSGKVSDVFVSDGGYGYTMGYVDFKPGSTGVASDLQNNGTIASFSVIIPPKGGHGYDIYRELGSYRVLIYSRYITDPSNPDTILGNDFARVGIIKNPTVPGSNVEILTTSEVSALNSLKLTGAAVSTTTYAVDSVIKQTVGTGITAIGFVASWDNITGVLKYYQPVGLATAGVNYTINSFSTSISTGGSLQISGAAIGSNLNIDNSFNGSSVVINSRTYQLGSNFISGISSSEYNKKSGEIIYIDNRQPIPRSANQKEDIKIVLEF